MHRRILMSAGVTALAVLGLATGGGAAAQPAATAAASTPRCHTADLSIRDLGKNGGAGSVFDSIRVKNVSTHTCHTRGFAGLTLISGLGNPLPTHVHRDGHSHTVTLSPGRSAAFMLSFHVVDLTHGGTSCHSHTARKLGVIPPDETTSRTVTLRDGGIKPCHGQLSEQAITG